MSSSEGMLDVVFNNGFFDLSEAKKFVINITFVFLNQLVVDYGK